MSECRNTSRSFFSLQDVHMKAELDADQGLISSDAWLLTQPLHDNDREGPSDHWEPHNMDNLMFNWDNGVENRIGKRSRLLDQNISYADQQQCIPSHDQNVLCFEDTAKFIDPCLFDGSTQQLMPGLQQPNVDNFSEAPAQKQEAGDYPLLDECEDLKIPYGFQSISLPVQYGPDGSRDDSFDDVAVNERPRPSDWPPVSDVCPTIERPEKFDLKVIARTGRDSGRNLLARFQNGDGRPRTRYDLKILSGRGPKYLQHITQYPPCTQVIPGGQTLREICECYPRHVWGTGLRIFLAQNWTGERVWQSLPQDFRAGHAAKGRFHNYIQKGFGREKDRMNDESNYIVPKIPRPAAKKQISEKGEDESEEDRELLSSQPERRAADPTREDGPEREFVEEFHKQDVLLLNIMHTLHPQFCSESGSMQLSRVRMARVGIFRDFGASLEDVADVLAFTLKLQNLVENLPLQRLTPLEKNEGAPFTCPADT